MADGDWTEFYKDDEGEHRWRIQAANGEVIDASSEAFVTEGSARRNYERAGHDLADAPEKEGGVMETRWAVLSLMGGDSTVVERPTEPIDGVDAWGGPYDAIRVYLYQHPEAREGMYRVIGWWGDAESPFFTTQDFQAKRRGWEFSGLPNGRP